MQINLYSGSVERPMPTPLVDVSALVLSTANPHNRPDLRALDGRDGRVQAYCESSKNWGVRRELLLHRIKMAVKNSKATELNVAIYCKKGRHRSVAMVETLARQLKKEHVVVVTHRELGGVTHG